MKIYTSYFYKLRFFKPNMIPISTAVYDPKWFHKNQGKDFIFIDKNNVINGIRAESFHPTLDDSCRGPQNCTHISNNCAFLTSYRNQLDKIPIDTVLNGLERLGEKVRDLTDFEGEPVFVFLVYETPDNPCSERGTIQGYFRKNGIECEELDIEKV